MNAVHHMPYLYAGTPGVQSHLTYFKELDEDAVQCDLAFLDL